MNATTNKTREWQNYLSPLTMTFLAINAVCFGGCITMLAVGAGSGPLILLTVGTGLSFGAGLIGAIVAARKNAETRNDLYKKDAEKGSGGKS